MNMQRSQNLTGRAVAFLSAIAASSLLGLPALAGGVTVPANKPGGPVQAPASSDQMQCTPTTQSNRSSSQSTSSQSNSPSSTAAPDAAATGAEQLPNQADPRAGVASSDQTASSRMDGSSANTPNVQTTKPAKNQTGASNANRGTATMGNTGAAMNSSNSMRSNTASRASSQSSQATAGMMSTPCPSGTMPGSSTPSSRQTPGQSNPDMRPSSQPTDAPTR